MDIFAPELPSEPVPRVSNPASGCFSVSWNQNSGTDFLCFVLPGLFLLGPYFFCFRPPPFHSTNSANGFPFFLGGGFRASNRPDPNITYRVLFVLKPDG